MSTTTATNEEEMVGSNLNDAQLYSFIAIICVSSSLSIMGSIRVLLLQRILTGQQQSGGSQRNNGSRSTTTTQQPQQRRTYHRLVSGLSIADVIFSSSSLLQPFLVDADRTVIPSAIGNEVTCNIIAFIFVWSNLVCTMHNAILSLHFWLVVVRRWTNDNLEKYYERPAKIIAWIWPLVTPCIALLGGYIEQGQVSMLCLNGVSPLPTLFYFVTSGLSVLMAILFTMWVYIFYRKQIVSTRRRSMNWDSQSNRIQVLAWRSVAYTLVYLNTIVWPILVNIIATGSEDTSKGVVYGLCVMSWIFLPLQGFLNLIIYIHPMIQQQNQANPDLSKMYLFYQIAIKGDILSHSPPRKRGVVRNGRRGSSSTDRQDSSCSAIYGSSLPKKLSQQTNGNMESIKEDSVAPNGGTGEAGLKAAISDDSDNDGEP